MNVMFDIKSNTYNLNTNTTKTIKIKFNHTIRRRKALFDDISLNAGTISFLVDVKTLTCSLTRWLESLTFIQI